MTLMSILILTKPLQGLKDLGFAQALTLFVKEIEVSICKKQ